MYNRIKELTTLVKTFSEQVAISKSISERNSSVLMENAPNAATLSTLYDSDTRQHTRVSENIYLRGQTKFPIQLRKQSFNASSNY